MQRFEAQYEYDTDVTVVNVFRAKKKILTFSKTLGQAYLNHESPNLTQ